MAKLIDITGQRFGRLVVVRRVRTISGRWVWESVCDCGRINLSEGHDLSAGKTTSCGCRRSEASTARRTTHGMRSSRTYRIWGAMKTRATNPNIVGAQNYVLRGIGICDRWLTFSNFLEDMGEAPENLSIDRIDNDKGYSPSNCRWASMKIQANNSRWNTKLTLDGVTMNLNQWADKTGISRQAIYRRIARGWEVRQALTTPVQKNSPEQPRQ